MKLDERVWKIFQKHLGYSDEEIKKWGGEFKKIFETPKS